MSSHSSLLALKLSSWGYLASSIIDKTGPSGPEYSEWSTAEVRDSHKNRWAGTERIYYVAIIYNRPFPCMEATYHYAIKTQRKAIPWSQPIRAQYLAVSGPMRVLPSWLPTWQCRGWSETWTAASSRHWPAVSLSRMLPPRLGNSRQTVRLRGKNQLANFEDKNIWWEKY